MSMTNLPRPLGELNGYPMYEVTEDEMTQEVLADDIYFLSPEEYQRVLTDLFIKAIRREIRERWETEAEKILKGDGSVPQELGILDRS